MATINTYLVTTSKHDIPGLQLIGRLFKGRRVRAYIYIRGSVPRDKLPRCRKSFRTIESLFHYLEKRSVLDYGQF